MSSKSEKAIASDMQFGNKETIRLPDGQYFEDFKVGTVYRHRPGRTISEADNTLFSLISMNSHPMHCDAAYARKSEFGKLLVNSGLTLAIVLGMTVRDISQKAIANLGWRDIKLLAPVFIGDTLYAQTEILDKRESKKRPTQGVVTTLTSAYKDDGTLFMEFERVSLIPKRGHAVDDIIGY
jgi:acyl dehydratase